MNTVLFVTAGMLRVQDNLAVGFSLNEMVQNLCYREKWYWNS